MFNQKSIILSMLLVLFSFTLFAQTLDEILNQHFQALGGYEQIKAIQSIKLTGTTQAQGMNMPFTMFTKRPNFMRLESEFQGQTMLQVYDGEKAWAIIPFMGTLEPQILPPDQAKNFKDQADIDGLLVDYKEKGTSIELAGTEELNGKPAYKLKLTLKNSDIRYVFLDTESYLTLKWTGTMAPQGTPLDVETYFSDYKTISGRPMPHKVETKVGEQLISAVTIATIEFNVEMADSLFKMPTQAGSTSEEK